MKKETWKRVARDAAYAYPRLHRQLEDLKNPSLTAKLTGMPRGGGTSRTVEDLALRQLPKGDQDAHDAVEKALRVMGKMRTGAKRRKLVEMVYFRRTHTLYGAGVALGISEETAGAWSRDFMVSVYAAMSK